MKYIWSRYVALGCAGLLSGAPGCAGLRRVAQGCAWLRRVAMVSKDFAWLRLVFADVGFAILSVGDILVLILRIIGHMQIFQMPKARTRYLISTSSPPAGRIGRRRMPMVGSIEGANLPFTCDSVLSAFTVLIFGKGRCLLEKARLRN